MAMSRRAETISAVRRNGSATTRPVFGENAATAVPSTRASRTWPLSGRWESSSARRRSVRSSPSAVLMVRVEEEDMTEGSASGASAATGTPCVPTRGRPHHHCARCHKGRVRTCTKRPSSRRKEVPRTYAPKVQSRPDSGLPHERGVCMFDTNSKRFAGMAGITFVVLNLVAFIAFVPSGLPDSGDPASKVLAYAHVHRSALLTSAFLQGLAVIPWIAFVSGIVVMMRRSEGETGMWSMMAAIGGAIAAAMAMVACALGAMLVYRAAAGDAGLARTLLDGNAIMFAMGGLPVAVFIYAASQGLVRAGAVARWM